MSSSKMHTPGLLNSPEHELEGAWLKVSDPDLSTDLLHVAQQHCLKHRAGTDQDELVSLELLSLPVLRAHSEAAVCVNTVFQHVALLLCHRDQSLSPVTKVDPTISSSCHLQNNSS